MKEHEDTLLRELHHAEKQLKDLQYAVPSQDTQQQAFSEFLQDWTDEDWIEAVFEHLSAEGLLRLKRELNTQGCIGLNYDELHDRHYEGG